MRLPNMDDLSARMKVPGKELDSKDKVGNYIQTLAGKVNEAYELVIKLNKASRVKRKAYHDRNTKLVTFSVGDYVYLIEMAVGVSKSKHSAPGGEDNINNQTTFRSALSDPNKARQARDCEYK